MSQPIGVESNDLKLVAVNVSSLAKRLSVVLSWNAHMLVCTEVRASHTAQKSLARRAHAMGYASVWSAPPFSGPTFEVLPGGVAIFAKDPCVIRKVSAPELHEWQECGRLVASAVTATNFRFYLLGLYGFAVSHPRHAHNEGMFAAIALWADSLTVPVLIVGDWNETIESSPFLSLSKNVGLWRISPDISSTRAKCQSQSDRLPIHHALVNSLFLDAGVEATISHAYWVSDHYPIEVKIKCSVDPIMIWRWPSVMKVQDRRQEPIPWSREDTSYTAWSQAAVKWISQNHQCAPCSKNVLTVEFARSKQCHVDQTYASLRSAQRLLSLPRMTPRHKLRLKRICRALEIVWQEPEGITVTELDRCLLAYLTMKNKEALAYWRKASSLWTVQNGELFRFLRNLPPAKPMMLVIGDRLSSDPMSMYQELSEYWSQVESWPTPGVLPGILDSLDDRYALFLPSESIHVEVTPQDMMKAVKRAKNSAPGPDGWSRKELVTLPIGAWRDFLHVLSRDTGTASLLYLYRRLPLEKRASSIPRVDQFRPIDVYSYMLRLHSSATVAKIRGWFAKCLASNTICYVWAGKAVAICNSYAEATLHRTCPVYAVSLDYQKLFNSISPSVAAHVARLMGMSEELITSLVRPLLHSLGVWRLPNNAICPWECRERGLPQGLASSVALSELFLAVLIRRLHGCVPIDSITYVDDVNVIAHSAECLEKALGIIWQFCADFFLTLSLDKTSLWGTDDDTLRDMAHRWGIQHKTTITILGTDWGLKPSESLTHEKEMARIAECKNRLKRLQHLSAPIWTKSTRGEPGMPVFV